MTPDCQPELNLRTKAARAVNRDSVEELCQLLRGRKWMTAREIQTYRPQWTERFIRALAEWSQRRVLSYPGSPGYRLTEELSAQEIEMLDHAGNSMISQGRQMARRGIGFRRLAALRRKAAEPA